MDIIAQTVVIVNGSTTIDGKKIVLHRGKDALELDEQGERWRGHKEASAVMADKMRRAGYKERAERMSSCARQITADRCPECGKTHITSVYLCRDRLCPTCSWRLSMRRYAEMCRVMSSLGSDLEQYTAGFLTLTVRNCAPDDLGATLAQMAQDWDRFIRRRPIARAVSGWARAVEVTYNSKARTMHPHYHILLLLAGDRRADVAELQTLFRGAWQSAGRLDYEPITDFRLVRPKRAADDVANTYKHIGVSYSVERLQGAILETYKYSVKSDELAQMPLPVFRALVAGIGGKRLTSFGGVIKTHRAALGLVDDDEAQAREDATDLQSIGVCDCGADMVSVIARWSMTDNQYHVVHEMAETLHIDITTGEVLGYD